MNEAYPECDSCHEFLPPKDMYYCDLHLLCFRCICRHLEEAGRIVSFGKRIKRM